MNAREAIAEMRRSFERVATRQETVIAMERIEAADTLGRWLAAIEAELEAKGKEVRVWKALSECPKCGYPLDAPAGGVDG